MIDLKHALAEHAERKGPVRIFFRDDDADRDLPELRRLLEAFGSRSIPLNLEVIPGTLTAGAARLLRDQPRPIEVNQHGWTHANHEAGGKKCEFGPSRDRARQFDDIRRGMRVLDDSFGDRWHRVFTPPWNRFTPHTIAAAAELGFRVFSANGETARCPQPLVSIPITLDMFHWKPARRAKPLGGVYREFASQIAERDIIGVLLHHKVMDADAFLTLETLLDQLIEAGRQTITFHTFESLCSA